MRTQWPYRGPWPGRVAALGCCVAALTRSPARPCAPCHSPRSHARTPVRPARERPAPYSPACTQHLPTARAPSTLRAPAPTGRIAGPALPLVTIQPYCIATQVPHQPFSLLQYNTLYYDTVLQQPLILMSRYTWVLQYNPFRIYCNTIQAYNTIPPTLAIQLGSSPTHVFCTNIFFFIINTYLYISIISITWKNH